MPPFQRNEAMKKRWKTRWGVAGRGGREGVSTNHKTRSCERILGIIGGEATTGTELGATTVHFFHLSTETFTVQVPVVSSIQKRGMGRNKKKGAVL